MRHPPTPARPVTRGRSRNTPAPMARSTRMPSEGRQENFGTGCRIPYLHSERPMPRLANRRTTRYPRRLPDCLGGRIGRPCVGVCRESRRLPLPIPDVLVHEAEGLGDGARFRTNRLPDYTRPMTAECLLCHSGRALPIDLTFNQYRSPPIARDGHLRDRCHGPVEVHLRSPSRTNIVNPAKLTPRARDSVCEQCHLSGEARIANPGRKLSDFQPGQEMENVFSTYVFAASRGGRPLKVISHAEQLRVAAVPGPARAGSGAALATTLTQEFPTRTRSIVNAVFRAMRRRSLNPIRHDRHAFSAICRHDRHGTVAILPLPITI